MNIFVTSIIILLATANQQLTKATMGMLADLFMLCSTKVQLALVKDFSMTILGNGEDFSKGSNTYSGVGSTADERSISEPTLYAAIVELIDKSTAQIILFGENLNNADSILTAVTDEGEKRDLHLTFNGIETTQKISSPFPIGGSHLLKPGDRLTLTRMKTNDASQTPTSFVHHGHPVVVRLMVPLLTTSPVVSFMDTSLADAGFSLVINLYGVNLDQIVSITLPLAPYSSTFRSIDISESISPYVVSSLPIRQDDSSSPSVSFGETLSTIQIHTRTGETLVYNQELIASQADRSMTMQISSIQIILRSISTVSIILSGSDLVPGRYALMWGLRSTAESIEAEINFPFLYGRSLISSLVTLDTPTTPSQGDIIQISKISPLDPNGVKLVIINTFESEHFIDITQWPEILNETTFVRGDGMEGLDCGFGEAAACSNLIQAIHNQNRRREHFEGIKNLTIRIERDCVVKTWWKDPTVSSSLAIFGQPSNSFLPIVRIDSSHLYVSSETEPGFLYLSAVELRFDTDFVYSVGFFVMNGNDMTLDGCDVSEAQPSCGTFLHGMNGAVHLVHCRFLAVFREGLLLRLNSLGCYVTLTDTTFTKCGSEATESLFSINHGQLNLTRMTMSSCSALEAPLSFKGNTFFVVCTACEWNECVGTSLSGSIAFTCQINGVLKLESCVWRNCRVTSAVHSPTLFFTFPFYNSYRIEITNPTFLDTEPQTKPYLMLFDEGGYNAWYIKLRFDYWTDKTRFLYTKDLMDFTPIADVPVFKPPLSVISGPSESDFMWGVDSPSCGADTKPCGTLGAALDRVSSHTLMNATVGVLNGGRAEVGTAVSEVRVVGASLSTRMLLVDDGKGVDGNTHLTTRNAEFESLVFEYSMSHTEVLMKHEEGTLTLFQVRFSSTSLTSNSLVRSEQGRVSLQLVSIDPVTFLSSPISISVKSVLSLCDVEAHDLMLASPFILVRGINSQHCSVGLNCVSLSSISFAESNELILDVRQATVDISDCQFVGVQNKTPSRPSRFPSFPSLTPRQLPYSHANILGNDDVCSWLTGCIVLDDCVSTISSSFFCLLPLGAIHVSGGTATLSSSSFEHNGQVSGFGGSKNIAVSNGAELMFGSMSYEMKTGGQWISKDVQSSLLRINPNGTSTPVTSPTLFQPLVESAVIDGSVLTVTGSYLFPCSLSVNLVPTDPSSDSTRPIECSIVSNTDGMKLICSFDETLLSLSKLEWRVSVSAGGVDASLSPIVRPAIPDHTSRQNAATALVSTSLALFIVFGVAAVVLMIVCIVLFVQLKSVKRIFVSKLQQAAQNTIRVQKYPAKSKNWPRHRRRKHRRHTSSRPSNTRHARSDRRWRKYQNEDPIKKEEALAQIEEVNQRWKTQAKATSSRAQASEDA
ncbi:hypothetical protein BLNAU_14135 [Blattamonas nauphoetae]|uniref:Transmembrane protein n=1 Tax=Blattamonas nauphoetae TaxID=2049346 RepID=A0ABQ9XHM8_9EUKA|nr:hypothetical protein BLNAU_14135 [Blattamonas nauphoetae]